MKRTTLGIATASVVALTLSACTGTSSNSGAGASAGSHSGAMTVQFVNPLPQYPAWRTTGDCMAKEAKKRGIDLTQSGPTGQAMDPTAMINQIQQAMANNQKAIVTLPASAAFAPLLKQAQSKGIITTTFYGDNSAASGADINIGVDWTEIGKLEIGAIAKRPGQQRVGLVAASSTGIGKDWLDGMEAAAAQTPNVKIVGSVYTGDDSAQALPQVTALLTAHPDLTYIATHMGTVTQGAVAALQSKGLTGKVGFMGVGPDNGGTQALKSGAESVMVLQGVCQMGTDAIDAIADRLEGKTKATSTPQFVSIGVKAADKAEAESLIGKGWG